jgi:hypothetical protein
MSRFAFASRMCVAPIRPQPPVTGTNRSGRRPFAESTSRPIPHISRDVTRRSALADARILTFLQEACATAARLSCRPNSCSGCFSQNAARTGLGQMAGYSAPPPEFLAAKGPTRRDSERLRALTRWYSRCDFRLRAVPTARQRQRNRPNGNCEHSDGRAQDDPCRDRLEVTSLGRCRKDDRSRRDVWTPAT